MAAARAAPRPGRAASAPRASPAAALGGRLLLPRAVEARVGAPGGNQLIVCAGLRDPATREDDDPPGAPNGREPVCDHDRGAAGEQALEPTLDLALRAHVHRRRRLVENQDPWV